MKSFSSLQEDLRKWFSKTDPGGDWKRINSKGEAIGPCAREPGEPKPKCMSRAKRQSLTKKERASAVAAKRKHDPDPERQGKPINVSNFGKGKISENMENLDEKNVPTNPSLWSQAKSLARSKFDVYPSAYANGWASKWYKGKGGSWKSVSEAKEESEYDYEGDMARGQLQSVINNAQRVHDMLKDNDNLPEWVQSKITLAEDYISTVANYMMSELDEAMSGGYYTSFHKETGKIGYIGNKNGMINHVKSNSDHIRGYTGPNTKVGDIFGGYPKKTVKEEVMQEGIKDEPHEIVHKDTGKTVSTHKNYKDAYSAYQDLSKASDHAIGHIPKKTNEQVESLGETKGAQAMKSSGIKQSQDKLLARTGMNLPHKFPRAGQTNLGNIPGINTPNVSKDTADYAEKRRGDRAKQLKPAIKAALGTHGPKGKLPEQVKPITELSADTLDRYKEKAKKSSDSLTSQGKYRQANDRTMNVMKATGKQINKTVANIRKALNREEVTKKDVNYPASPAQLTLKPSNKSQIKESRQLQIVREALADAKKKDQLKKKEKKLEASGDDKFQSEPELSSQINKTSN